MTVHVPDSSTTVRETSAETRIAPGQRFEAALELGGELREARIAALHLASPGFTSISFDASARENAVRVSGDSEDAVRAVQVAATASRGLEIRAAQTLKTGHLLVEVVLAHPRAVKSIDCTGAAVVVIDENVVASGEVDSRLQIEHSGSGDLYLSDGALKLQSFALASVGRADIQLATPSLEVAEHLSVSVTDASETRVFTNKIAPASASFSISGAGDFQLAAPSWGRTDTASSIEVRERLSFSVAGSGDMNVFFPIVRAGELSSSVTGSGDIRVLARHALAADSLSSSIVDSGSITICGRPGSAASDTQTVSIIGHGRVDTGDVATVTTSVSAQGSNSVTVQASKLIRASVQGAGVVQYVGTGPVSIEGSVASVKGVERDSAKHHARLSQIESSACHVPEKHAAFSSIGVGGRSKGIYKLKIHSFSELKTKLARFFGFSRGNADGVAVPERTPTAGGAHE